MPPATQKMMNEADIDDVIGLLDLSLSSSRLGDTAWVAGAAPGCGLPLASFDVDEFGDALPPMASNDNQAASSITKKQLRALRKNHLLMMLRDAEKELVQEKEKNGYLLLAYQALLSHRK